MKSLRCRFLLGCLAAAIGFSVQAQPCPKNLADCPKRGCAKVNTDAAYLSIQKRRIKPINDSLVRLTFADFQNLQTRAEQIFHADGGHHALSKTQRARLRNLETGGQAVGEGWKVEIAGFITILPKDKSKPHANSGESVNCNLTGKENNDFHISLTADLAVSEWKGIVAEMVPQDRNEKWTEKQLKEVQKAQKMVRVRGLLFFDNHHKVNGNESTNISNQPKRISLWELHPVLQFEVCTLSACDPAGSSGWKNLEDWP